MEEPPNQLVVDVQASNPNFKVIVESPSPIWVIGMCEHVSTIESSRCRERGAAGLAWRVSREQALRAEQSRQKSHGSRLGNDSLSHPCLLCLGVM